MQCDHDLGQLESKQGQAQIQMPLNSDQINCLGGIIKTMLKIKHCPKIMLLLLLNPKYSVDHDPPSWRF